MRQVRIGIIKAVPEKWKVAENWVRFEELVRRFKDEQIDLFLAPECFLDGYAVTEPDWTEDKFAQVAQKIDESPYIERLKQLALEAKTCFVFGFTERVADRFYNCALLLGRHGEIKGKYYKTHLQSHDTRFAPGIELPVFSLDFGVVGIVICADRRWPETIRALRLKGAEIALIPSYGMWHLDNEWWMRTRAYENEMFLCFAHPQVAFICNPKGEIVAKLQSNMPGMLVHQVDIDEVSTKMLRDRRPDLYGNLESSSTSPGFSD